MLVQMAAWPRDLERRVESIIAEKLRMMPEVKESFRQSVACSTAFDVMKTVWAETFPDTIKNLPIAEVLPADVIERYGLKDSCPPE